jgi:hypothetical protein
MSAQSEHLKAYVRELTGLLGGGGTGRTSRPAAAGSPTKTPATKTPATKAAAPRATMPTPRAKAPSRPQDVIPLGDDDFADLDADTARLF